MLDQKMSSGRCLKSWINLLWDFLSTLLDFIRFWQRNSKGMTEIFSCQITSFLVLVRTHYIYMIWNLTHEQISTCLIDKCIVMFDCKKLCCCLFSFSFSRSYFYKFDIFEKCQYISQFDCLWPTWMETKFYF